MKSPDVFGRADKASSRAFKRVNKVFGFQADPDLQLYNNLKPADFDAISRKYGPDVAADYIRWAESRKLTQKE